MWLPELLNFNDEYEVVHVLKYFLLHVSYVVSKNVLHIYT